MPGNPDNNWTVEALLRDDHGAIAQRLRNDPDYIRERDFHGDTPLLAAIRFSALDVVHVLLRNGADPNAAAQNGLTGLQLVTLSESGVAIEILLELIRAGADVHAFGFKGWTALHLAANSGRGEMVRALLEMGADVNQRMEVDGQQTPLMLAASFGQPLTVRILLEHGADPTLRDMDSELTAQEIAEEVARGPDPETVALIRRANLRSTNPELFTDQIPPEVLQEIDPAQEYIDSMNSIAQEGRHAEVARVLADYRR